MAALKFQTRLTVVYLALFLAVQGVVVLFFYNSVDRNVTAQVQGQLDASARVFERIINEQIDDLGGRAQDLARDFGFKQAIATADGPTIQSAFRNFKSRIEADLMLVYDTDDTVLASEQQVKLEGSIPLVSDDLKDKAEEDGFSTAILEINGKIYELVVVPVMAPVPVAWIALGIELDRLAALEIQSLSPIELEIAFLYEKSDRYMLASSTSDEETLGDFVTGAMLKDRDTVG